MKYIIILTASLCLISCNQKVYTEAGSLEEIVNIAKKAQKNNDITSVISLTDFYNKPNKRKEMAAQTHIKPKILKNEVLKKVEVVKFDEYDFYTGFQPEKKPDEPPYVWNIKPSHLIIFHYESKHYVDQTIKSPVSMILGIFEKNNKF